MKLSHIFSFQSSKLPLATQNQPTSYRKPLLVAASLFLSGRVHCNSNLELVGDTTEEKLAQIMKNIETILKAAGAKLNDIVKVVINVTDMSMMPDLNKAYAGYFSDPLPVREAVCVKALPLVASIEISVIASK